VLTAVFPCPRLCHGVFCRSTTQVLDALQEKGARATFFVVGEQVRAPSMGAVLQRAIREGHWIGSHGDNQTPFDELTDEALAENLAAVDAAVQSVSCFRPRLVRAPYGRTTAANRAVLQSKGYKLGAWRGGVAWAAFRASWL